MAPRSKTASSTPRLSEYARSFVYPPTIWRTVWTRVEARGRELGLGFDWWQSQLGTVVLGYDTHGKYVATVGGVGMSIPRQVGKTYFVMAMVVILCILFPGLQVVWTSHHLRTTNKTLTAIRGLSKRKHIAPHVRAVRTSHGEGQVEFHNGSTIMFGARSQGFGRGFDEVDVEVFDEAQILDLKALEDMVAATNQSRHEHGALVLFMGTPPRPADPSEAFATRREKAIAGRSENAIWLEIGADPDSDPDDRSQWSGMNPSWPARTPTESLLRLRELLGDDDSWNREGRGIWDAAKTHGAIPLDAWSAQGDPESLPVDRFALGIEVGPDLVSASVSLAGQRADGDWHVELDEHRSGAHWLCGYVRALVAANPQIRAVVGDVGGPLSALTEQRGERTVLKGTRIAVTAPRVKDLGSACALMLNGTVGGTVWNLAQPQMGAAVQAAGKRSLGDTGMWVFSRKTATADITPIQSATWALIGAQRSRVRRPAGTESTGSRRAVVLA